MPGHVGATDRFKSPRRRLFDSLLNRSEALSVDSYVLSLKRAKRLVPRVSRDHCIHAQVDNSPSGLGPRAMSAAAFLLTPVIGGPVAEVIAELPRRCRESARCLGHGVTLPYSINGPVGGWPVATQLTKYESLSVAGIDRDGKHNPDQHW